MKLYILTKPELACETFHICEEKYPEINSKTFFSVYNHHIEYHKVSTSTIKQVSNHLNRGRKTNRNLKKYVFSAQKSR